MNFQCVRALFYREGEEKQNYEKESFNSNCFHFINSVYSD